MAVLPAFAPPYGGMDQSASDTTSRVATWLRNPCAKAGQASSVACTMFGFFWQSLRGIEGCLSFTKRVKFINRRRNQTSNEGRGGSGRPARLYLRFAPTEPTKRFRPIQVTILARSGGRACAAFFVSQSQGGRPPPFPARARPSSRGKPRCAWLVRGCPHPSVRCASVQDG